MRPETSFIARGGDPGVCSCVTRGGPTPVGAHPTLVHHGGRALAQSWSSCRRGFLQLSPLSTHIVTFPNENNLGSKVSAIHGSQTNIPTFKMQLDYFSESAGDLIVWE